MSLAQRIRENRATVICGVLIAAVLAAGFVMRGHAAGGSDGRFVALVHDGEGHIHEMPLDEDATLTLTTSLGTNTIVVEDGSVRMSEADCPNGTCLREQPLDAPGRQIICLPHELWIEVVPEGDAGGEMDVTLATNDDDVDLVAQ